MAVNAMVYGEGYYVRRYVIGGCLFLHGFRMFAGALKLFYPYTFPNGDLPRYKYAKVRFEEKDGMASHWWPFKVQHDTL